MHVPTAWKYHNDYIENNNKKWNHNFQHYKSIGDIFNRSRADNSILCGPIWFKLELLLDIMHVLNTYIFKTNRINSNWDIVATSTLRSSRAANCGSRLDMAEFQPHQSTYVCHHYLQVRKGSDQEQLRKSDKTLFPIISLWKFFQTLKGS